MLIRNKAFNVLAGLAAVVCVVLVGLSPLADAYLRPEVLLTGLVMGLWLLLPKTHLQPALRHA